MFIDSNGDANNGRKGFSLHHIYCCVPEATPCKLDTKLRELRHLESRGLDVASRGFLNCVVPDDKCI